VLSGEDIGAAGEGLNHAAGRIQGAVGQQTRLKRTPRLHFEPDPVVENVSRIEAALRALRNEEGGNAREDQ
jgi:ribosome-binding factor A